MQSGAPLPGARALTQRKVRPRAMARILSIQSQVIYGHVGNSAAAFALERLGHEVLAMPTVVLPHHPGHGRVKAKPTPPEEIKAWLETLEARGWLKDCAAVVTGYFGSAEQIPPVAKAIARMKDANPELLYLCDPVFGDLPGGAYLPRATIDAIAKHLLPLADIATPNAFEAADLTGRKILDRASALRAAAELGPPNVFITSVPADDEKWGDVGTLAWQRPGEGRRRGGLQKTGSWLATVPKHTSAPHGAGDLFTALMLGHVLNQMPVPAALNRTSATLTDLIGLSVATQLNELPLISGQETLMHPSSLVTLTPLGAGAEGQWVAGASPCPGGWLAVLVDLSGHMAARFRLCKTFKDVLALEEQPAVITASVPIGLPDVAMRGGRRCDTAARARLGERRSTVLTPPARAALAEHDFNEASAVNLKHSVPPRKVSKHTFGIFPYIREVDDALTPADQVRVFESHPEVSFWAMNGERPVAIPKRVKHVPHAEGLDARRGLLAANGFEVRFLASFNLPRKKAGPEDFLDACACAYAAARIAKGEAVQLPQDPGRDGRGLRMEIWG